MAKLAWMLTQISNQATERVDYSHIQVMLSAMGRVKDVSL